MSVKYEHFLMKFFQKVISSWHNSHSTCLLPMARSSHSLLNWDHPGLGNQRASSSRVEVLGVPISAIICFRLIINTISSTMFVSHYKGEHTHTRAREKHRHFCFHGWAILDLLYQLRQRSRGERSQTRASMAGVWDFLTLLKYWVSCLGVYCQLFPLGTENR